MLATGWQKPGRSEVTLAGSVAELVLELACVSPLFVPVLYGTVEEIWVRAIFLMFYFARSRLQVNTVFNRNSYP